MNGAVVHKGYYLTIDEFVLLLYKGEIQGLIFPDSITDAVISDKRFKKALSELVKNDLVVSENFDEFMLSEIAKQWISVLQYSKNTVIYDGDGNSNYYVYVYEGENEILSLQRDKHRVGWIRLELLPKDDYIDYLGDFVSKSNVKCVQRYEVG